MRLFVILLSGITLFSSSPLMNTVYAIRFLICHKPFDSSKILNRALLTTSLLPLVSLTPTASPTLKLLLMACLILSILLALESGAFIFEVHSDICNIYLHILSVPTLAISPWVEAGVIEHSGINNGLTYTHSSIAAFIAVASFSSIV